jgi:putative hydroxymethylpyrimidine transport system substrate-binding protein
LRIKTAPWPRPLAARRAPIHPARPLSALLLPLAICAIALSACGEKKDAIAAKATKPWTVMLDFFPNADHAPLYAAITNGDFRNAGLEVKPQTPANPAQPLQLLAAGRVDMAISYEPELLLARDAGLRLVSIGALVQRPLTSIIALPGSHVTKVADLKGKKVGTAGIPYQAAELRTALQAAGVSPSSVQEVNVGFNLVPAMLSGKVAATLGGFWNYEAIQLEELHKRPLTIPVNQAGVPNYDELVLVVREEEARREGQDLRAFMQALSRGEREVKGDPAAAAKLIVAANPSLESKLQLTSIQRTLPAEIPDPANPGRPYGWQDPAQWAAFGSWMLAHGLVSHNPNATGLPPFTNEFLPGEGI